MKKFIFPLFAIALLTQCGTSKGQTTQEVAPYTSTSQQTSNKSSSKQDVTTVTATSDDISDNLDLEAVAAVFGESKDLEDFEKRLNDPDSKISNLDLNEDGEVDYLRVVGNSDKDTHVVSIQAVIGKDQYQDVATIDVEKNNEGETTVQVVGDVYMYGTNYIITPVYVSPPVVVTWFWAPYYRPYYSPYYWGYYPPYYNPWRPIMIHHYRTHAYARAHHYHRHSYHHTSKRVSHHAVNVQSNNRRNDMATTRPNKSFEKRNKGVSNKEGLSNRAATTNKDVNKSNRAGSTTTGRKTDNNWKSTSNGRVHQSNRPTTRPSSPSTRPSTPSTRPSNPSTRPSNPSTRPSSPSTRPSSPSTRPSTPSRNPSTRPTSPSTRPAARPSYNQPSRSSAPSSRSMGGRRR